MEQRVFLQEEFEKIHIHLTEEQTEQFMLYYTLLVEWNEKMNLTAITDFEDVVVKHFVDSAAIAGYTDLSKVHHMIDVGTGAGFPGIPLKILYPHIQVVLMDSLNKRLIFLNEVISRLQLQKVVTVHGRAEDLGHQEGYREKMDLCVSRAVANMSTLLEYCLPFVRPGGYFISYKSGNYSEELKSSEKACKILGGRQDKVQEFRLPDTDMERSFIFFKKVNKTTKKFPRKAGMPSKSPIM